MHTSFLHCHPKSEENPTLFEDDDKGRMALIKILIRTNMIRIVRISKDEDEHGVPNFRTFLESSSASYLYFAI